MIENLEKEIIDKLVEAHNIFITLDQTHPADIDEWSDALHSCQKIIMTRIARRVCPEIFPKKII